MANLNIFECVDSRFYFFDGTHGFTVECSHAIPIWTVYKDRERSRSVFQKSVKYGSENIDRYTAEDILYQYFDTIKQDFNKAKSKEGQEG